MEFASSVVTTIVDVLAGVGALLLAAIIGVIIVRSAPIVIPAAYRFGLAFGAIVGQVGAMAFRMMQSLAAPLVWLSIVAGVFLAAVRTGPIVWTAYGSDVPALIPAIFSIALPIGTAIGTPPPIGRTWGALTAWGAIVFAIGAIVEVSGSIARSLYLVGALTTITAYTQLTGEISNETRQEQQRIFEVD